MSLAEEGIPAIPRGNRHLVEGQDGVAQDACICAVERMRKKAILLNEKMCSSCSEMYALSGLMRRTGERTRDGEMVQPCEMLNLSNNLHILLKECILIPSPIP